MVCENKIPLIAQYVNNKNDSYSLTSKHKGMEEHIFFKGYFQSKWGVSNLKIKFAAFLRKKYAGAVTAKKHLKNPTHNYTLLHTQ